MGAAVVANTSRASTTLCTPPALIAATASATACSQRGPGRLPSSQRGAGRGDDPPRPPRSWGDPSPQTPLGGDDPPRPPGSWGDPSPQTPLGGDSSPRLTL